MDELRKYYDYLKGAGADVPNTFESFSNTLQEEESAKEYYKYLVGAGFDAPSTFDSFSNTLLKKKEPTKQEVGQEVGVSVEEPTPSPSVSQEQVEEAPASALDQLKPLSQIFEAPMFTDPVERAGGAIESPEIDILSDEDEEMLKSEKPYGFEKYITGAYEDPKEDLKAKRNALIKHQKETEEKYAAYPEEERMQLMSETQADYGEIFLNYLDKTDPNNSRRLREQRESDIDFYSDTDKITLPFVPRQSVEVLEESGMIPKILPEVKRISPANQIRLNGLQLVMDVKQDNLDSSVKAFDDKYGNEFTALTDKLQGMQNLISGNTFNGTEDQYNEYMNGVNRLKELESTPEYLGYQQSFDEYKLFEEEYKKDSVVREADLAALEAYSYQLKKDEEYKESGLLGRSFINASDITKGAVMRLFQSAATLPKILMPDNEYALSDGLKDYVDNVAKVYNERNPKPSAFTKEGLTSSIANVNGYEVEIDGDEPTGRVFDKDGYLLPRKTVAGYTTFSDTDDVFAEDIVKVYESNKDEYDIEETINIASNLYTAGEVTADMFVTLAPISRAVTLTTKAGTASKAAKLLRIGEVSEKTAGNFGTFTGVMVQSSNGFYDAAIEAGASEAEASAFSAFQSAIIGTIALLNPVESKAIANMFTGQSSKEYAKKYVSEILKGKTRSEAMKSVVSNVVKKAGQLNYEMFKEGIEEITEIPAGQFGDYLFDLGTTTPGEIQDYIDTFAVAYLASGPMSLISLRGNNPNMSTMLYSAMGDMEYVENLLKKNINKEVRLADGGKKLITEEFVQEQMDRLNRIKTVSEPYLQNEALTEDEKKLVVSLVNKRQALSETLKNADDVVGKKSKQEIEAINTQLERFLDKKDGSPFYLVEGKAISKEELDEKIADENWVKGFKEGRWAVHITNDQDAINRLKEATEGKPVVEAEVEAEVEEAPVEEQVSVNKGDKIQFSSDGQVFDGVVTRQTEDGVYIESDVSGEETLIPTNKVIATADMGIVAGDNVFIETDAGPILGEVKSVTDTEVEIDNPDIPGETITIDRSKARKIKEGDEVQYNVAGELETFKVKRVEGDQVVVENPDIPGGEISLSAGEVTLKDPFKRVEDDTQVAEQERVDTEEQGREEDTGQVQEPEVSEEEGAADTVLQENQEVEATDSSVNELIDELNATDPKTVPPSKTREMVKVARNVKKALNTLSKLLPDVKIVVHKTSEGYVSSAEGRFSGEGGEYNPDTKTIHINLEKATPTTVAHEVFHAVLIESLGTVDTQETTDEMYERILKSAKLSNEVRTKIEEHKAKYPEGIQSEEALAELTGILASEYSSLSLTAKGAVKSWVNKLSRAVGLGNMFDQVARDKEVIDLLNVLSGKLSRGEVLEEADVKEISRRKKPTEKKSEKKPESKKKPKKEEKKPSERVSRQDRRLVERAAEKAKMAVEDFVFAVASGTYDVSEKVSKVVDKLIKQRVIDIVNSIQSAGLSNESKEKLRKLIPSINKEDIKSIMSDVYEMLPKPKIDKISQLAKRRGKSVVDFLYDSVKNFDNLTQSVYEAVNPFLNKLYKAIALTAMLNVSISYGTDFTGAIDSLIAKIPVKEIAVNMTKVATSVNAVDSAITDLVVDGAFGEYNTTIERLMVKAGSESMVTKADESFETKVKDDAEIKKEQEAVKKELERLEQAKSDSAAIAVNNEILEKNTHYNSDNRYEKTLHAFDNQYPNLDKFGNYIGQIVGVLPPKSARQERGINSVDGIGMIQHNLDGDVYTGVYMDANNSLHRTSKTAITDSKGDTYGYVQVYEFLEGSNGERARVVYKKYSEVPDSELKNTTPFRQFLYKDIDFSKKYDAQGFKGKDKDGNRTVGSIGLKNGKKNPYYIGNKEVINKDAVDINFAKKAPSAYGSFSGTAVTFIFKDKAGNQYVSEFAGSVPAIKEHGDNLMKIYGDQDMVIGYHDVGSFNYKTKGVDGKINTTRIDRMNKDVSLKDLSGGGKAQLQDYAGSGTYKLLPSEQEALEKANPVRQNVRKQIIGRNAKLSSEVRNNLLRARSMESRRKNKKDIKIQTGWERGKDNKWRYEIPDDIPYFKSVTKAISDVLLGKRKADSFGIINENGKLTISGKLAFPGNILDAYPELENYDVSFNKWINEGEGEMSALFETIDVGIGEVNTAEDIEESMSKAIPVLIHEIQHAIQRIEDFGRGGNKEIGEELLKSKFPKAKELYEQLVSDRNFVESVIDEHRNLPQGKELVTAIKQAFLEQSIVDFEEGGAKLFQVADKIHNSPKFKKVAGMIGLKRGKETIQGIEKILSDSRELTGSMDPSSLMNVISQINFEISKISDPKTPFETYQRIAGEVEARNVMERMEMSEELRAETTLEETEDVAREDQIVIGVARPLVLAKKARTPKKPPLKKAPPKKISDIRKQKVDQDKKAYEDGSKELNQKVKKKEDAQRSYSDRKIVPLIRTLRKRFFDFQGFTKSMLRKAELGRIADRLTNAKGAGGRAKAIFKEYYDKIYDGLSVSERKHLDNLITYRRIVSANEARIRSNAEAEIEFEKVSQEIKDLKAKSKLTKDEKAELKKLESKKKDLKKKKDRGEIMTGSIGLDDAKAAIRGLESIVGSEVFEKINGRANEYFGAFDEMLDKDLKDGLVTQEQYDAMKGIDYSPRVWMTYIYDLEGDAVLMRDALDRLKKKFSLSEANYQTLKDGLKNDDPNMLGTLMMDSEILLSTYLNTREKKRSFNNLNQEMAKELAKLIPEFEELSAKKDLTKEEKKRLKYLKQVNDSFSLTPRTGFREMFYYSEGKREKFYVKDEIYDEWYDNKKGVLDKSIESGISKWTGVKLLKAAATGANPLFAITNFPRDFFQVLLFSNAYSNILPKSMAQLTVDFFKSWAMIHKDSKEFKEFVKYGGMMDFLYTDGRVDQGAGMKSKIKDFIASTKVGDKGYYKGAKLFEKAADLASYLNMISEIGFRLSVYNKVLSNEMKKLDKDRKGMTPEEIMMAEEDARYRAAAAARELIDFSIGGDVIKGADPYLPYINAAAQGTYTALRYSYENPAAISIKTLQATGLVSTGIMLLGSALVGANRDDDDENSVKEIMTKTYNGVSPHIRKNYFIIPLGTKDEKGDYKYFKIAKNQSLSPFFVLTESIMESFYLDNKESNKNLGFRMLDSFSSSFMPLDINPYTPEGEMEGFNVVGNTFSKNPVFGGILEWSTGYNFFRNEPLSRDAYSTKIGSDAWNNFSDSRTEEFYKDFAQFMDENGVPAASPAKIKNSVERLITSPYTNPFTNALYVTLESQTDYAKSFNKQSVIEDVTKSIMKGFAGEKRLIGSANYKPEDSKLNKSQKESIDKKISDINKGKAIAKTYGRRIGKELSMDQEFINASNKDKMKIAQGKFDQVVDFASRKGIELEPKEMEMLQRKFMSQVNIRNRDIELYKFYDVMYETDPRIQALTWINEFGYLDPKSDDYKELMIEYKNTYKKTMGKNVSDKFFQNIGRYYKEEGMN